MEEEEKMSDINDVFMSEDPTFLPWWMTDDGREKSDSEIIYEFRCRHKLTQQRAAEILGYSGNRAIRSIENGTLQRNGEPTRLSSQARKAMIYFEMLREFGLL